MGNIKQAGRGNAESSKELAEAPPDKKADIVEVIFREAYGLKNATETHNRARSLHQNGKC